MANETPTPRRGSCLGRVVKLALVLLILAGLFVVFLPALLSSGPGTRLIERAAAGSIDGTLGIDDLSLSWTGAQSITGLRIADAAGKPVANLDLSVSNGLIDLARGGWKRLDASVAGSVEVEIRPDGTTNAASVAKGSASPAAAPAPSGSEPTRLPAGLDARIALTGLDVTLREQATGRVVKLSDLKGEIVAGTVRPLLLKLNGASEFEGRVGSIAVEAKATDLVRADGALTFAGAKVDASAKIGSLALPLPGMLVEVKSLDATLTSADLTTSVNLDLESAATLNGSTASSATAKVVARELFRPDGSVDFRPERVVADVVARNVPTAIAEPFLKGQPVVLSRDVGPTVDATIHFPGGGGDLAIKLDAQNLAVDGTGSIDPQGGLVVSSLTARTSVQPALLEAAAGLTPGAAIPVVAESRRIVIPAATSAAPGNAAPGSDLAKVSIESLTVRLPGTVPLGRPSPDGVVALGAAQDLAVTIESPSLDREVHVTASGGVEGGTLAIDQRLTNLFGADGAVDAGNAVAVGTIALTGIAPQRILNVLEPDTAQIARELLTGPVEVRLTTAGGAERQARLAMASGALRAEADAVLKGSVLDVASAKAVVPATSGLLAALQKGSEKPIQTTPTALTAVVAPFSIDVRKVGGLLRDGPPLSAQIALADATFSNVPGTATPLGLNQFAGTATITPGSMLRVAFDGGARTTAGGASLASLSLKVNAERNQDRPEVPLALTADIAAPDIQVAAAEALLGRPSGSLSNLLGKSGAVSLTAAPQGDGSMQLSATPNFETLKGQIAANVAGSLVSMKSSRVELTLSPQQLSGLVTGGGQSGPTGPAGPTGPKGTDGTTLTFSSPLKVTADVGDTVLDLNAFSDQPFDPARLRTTIDVTTSPLAMALSTGQKIDFEKLTARFSTPRIDQGVTLSVDGRGAGGAVLVANGAIRNLVDARSILQPAGATVDLKAELKQFPTLLLDRVKDLDGLLVTTLGDLLEGSLNVTGLSKTAGTISASLSAANGRLDLPLATVRDGLVVIEPAKPITGQLAITKPLRDRLLYRINPILADIRQTQQPIKLAIPAFAYPTDGNLARLDGDVQLTFGEVEFDAGSQLLGLLEIFNKKQAPVIPGLVEPLNVAIRKGQLAYQDFALRVGRDDAGWKQALVFSGDIDLTQTPPYARAIKSMYPASGLSRSIKELQNVPALSAVSVGVTFYGPLYDPAGNTTTLQRKLDVQIKPEDILKDKNIQKGIDDLLKKIK